MGTPLALGGMVSDFGHPWTVDKGGCGLKKIFWGRPFWIVPYLFPVILNLMTVF